MLFDATAQKQKRPWWDLPSATPHPFQRCFVLCRLDWKISCKTIQNQLNLCLRLKTVIETSAEHSSKCSSCHLEKGLCDATNHGITFRLPNRDVYLVPVLGTDPSQQNKHKKCVQLLQNWERLRYKKHVGKDSLAFSNSKRRSSSSCASSCEPCSDLVSCACRQRRRIDSIWIWSDLPQESPGLEVSDVHLRHRDTSDRKCIL